MKRLVYNDLLSWKSKPNRKPLLIKGARQVGKTWLMKEFGKNEYKSVAYINFEKATQLTDLFKQDFDTSRILRSVQLVTGILPIPGETLIIFDELQSVPRGLLSLKYFYEDVPEYHIVAAGSLLGLSTHHDDSFPVGKVDFLELCPLSFEEFLIATGNESLHKTVQSQEWKLIKAFRNNYIELLKHYYYIGGMPEVVSSFIQSNNYTFAREIQSAILESYINDFSKHPPLDIVPRIKMVWDAIPSQLAKENRKFIYGAIKSGGRAKEFELAIMWLEEAGLIHKVNRITNASLPLKGFADINAFKLFAVDIGLLGAKSGLDAKSIIQGNQIFGQYKGALTEQFVLQQLKFSNNIETYYWSSEKGIAEVDFVIQAKGKVIPIEVKAEENLKSKSLKSYRDKFHPEFSLRTSMSDFRIEETLTNIPLYTIFLINKII
ncbi:MAG: AAA family ATPase [Bacteroidales bacterium]|nr:AAA family ATPase [Bacteroidales bacterium]MDD2425541.1 AAA family ATPase [Bacteroidales bacterium]MDD3990000.1 AAA family ATPase [Bacteroidales bacterium]MDD4638184.1 AAA family ATPase [Bacteroidales bacterium]